MILGDYGVMPRKNVLETIYTIDGHDTNIVIVEKYGEESVEWTKTIRRVEVDMTSILEFDVDRIIHSTDTDEQVAKMNYLINLLW